MRSRPSSGLTGAFLLGLVWVASVVSAGADDLSLRDRIVAVVDEDPIYFSDLERAAALGLYPATEDETALQRRRRLLDRLIENRLRLHEVDKYRLAPLAPEQVDQLYEQFRGTFPDPEAYDLALERGGLDQQAVRQILVGRLKVEQYIEERLRPRIFVDLEDIRAYYDGEFTAGLAKQGIELPAIETVREQIRGLLREQRLNLEIESWTEELRQAADIEDYFERSLGDQLPPLTRRLERPASSR